MKDHKLTSAKLQCFFSMFLFGTIGIFVRGIPLSSTVIALARGIIGMIFLLAVMGVRREKIAFGAVKKNLPVLILSGAALGINWILLFEAYRYTTVAVATICYYLAPVFVVAASPLLLHERLTVRKVVCSAVSLLGMVFVSGVIGGGTAESSSNGRGILLGLAAAVFYAAVVMLNKKLTGLSAYERTVMQLGISAAVLLPYVLVTGGLADIAAVPATGILLLLVVGIVHTGVTYALYFGSMAHLPAQTAALLSYIDPVVAVLLSALLLHEPLGIAGIIGAVLVLGSTMVSEGCGEKLLEKGFSPHPFSKTFILKRHDEVGCRFGISPRLCSQQQYGYFKFAPTKSCLSSIKFFDGGLGETFFQKSFPQESSP